MRALLVFGWLFAANALIANAPKAPATIQRIVEIREGRKSCWGVTIRLTTLSFKKSVSPDQLSIIEAKEDHQLKNIMVWRVDRSRKILTIKFKKGCGDFGTGNLVEVTIKSSALVGTPKQDIALSIKTDS